MTATRVEEAAFGHRSAKGEWSPLEPTQYAPVFVWPPRPAAFAKWLVRDYVLGQNLLYFVAALIAWLYLTPSASTLESWGAGWVVAILARNLGVVLLLYGALHLRLYVRKAQGDLFKFRARDLKTDSPLFLFRNQTRDNMFWTLGFGVPIWTGFECLMLWAHANGNITPLTWAQHPVTVVLFVLAIPLFRDLHFYAVHRLLHVPALYKPIHKLHHNNTNPGPWSGLAMHPVEHLVYFTGVLIHFVVAAHPIHIIYQLMHAGLAPAVGHAGYSKLVVTEFGDPQLINLSGYNHYLHHKYFECNYADGPIPFDKWFGTFHDGTPEAHAAMKARLQDRP